MVGREFGKGVVRRGGRGGGEGRAVIFFTMALESDLPNSVSFGTQSLKADAAGKAKAARRIVETTLRRRFMSTSI